MSEVRRYASLMPDELRRAIKGLDDEKRMAITMFLLEKAQARFTDLSQSLELEKNDLTYHLRQLSDGLIIEKVAISADDKIVTLYRLTDYGSRLFESLRSTILKGRLPAEHRIRIAQDYEIPVHSGSSQFAVGQPVGSSPSWEMSTDEERISSDAGSM